MYDIVGMFVYEGTECEAIPPARGHVSDLDSRIVLHLPPAPLLQGCHSENTHHILIYLSTDDTISTFNSDNYREDLVKYKLKSD